MHPRWQLWAFFPHREWSELIDLLLIKCFPFFFFSLILDFFFFPPFICFPSSFSPPFLSKLTGSWELGASADTLSYVSPASDSAAAAQLSWTGARQADFPHVPGRTALWSAGTAALRPGAQRCERSWQRGESSSCGSYSVSSRTRKTINRGEKELEPSPPTPPLLSFLFYSVDEKEKGQREGEIYKLLFLPPRLTCWRNKRKGSQKKECRGRRRKSISLDIERSGACGYWLSSFPSASWMVSRAFLCVKLPLYVNSSTGVGKHRETFSRRITFQPTALFYGKVNGTRCSCWSRVLLYYFYSYLLLLFFFAVFLASGFSKYIYAGCTASASPFKIGQWGRWGVERGVHCAEW